MGKEILIILQVLFPIVAGCLLFVVSRRGNRKIQMLYVMTVLVLELFPVFAVALMKETAVELFPCNTPSAIR